MNNSTQAKNGFKTFIITFGISLLVFGFFYYLLSDVSVENISIEDQSANTVGYTKPVTAEKATPKRPANVVAETPTTSGPRYAGPAPTVAGVTDSRAQVENKEDSPFGKLSESKPKVNPTGVLAGSDATTTETTQSTAPVPETGDFMMTAALVASLGLLAFFVYLIFLNPRRYALSKFEEDVLRDF
jgi:hypothetical protein